MLPDPQEYVEDPDYYDTGDTVKKQKIILDINVKVIEYEARIFRNRKTASRVHAAFPEGYVNASVSANNSLAERLARVYKRKQRQATVLRSDDSFEYLCDSLGLTYTLRYTAGNLYKRVSDIFKRNGVSPQMGDVCYFAV